LRVSFLDQVQTAAEWLRLRNTHIPTREDIVQGVSQIVARDAIGLTGVIKAAPVPKPPFAVQEAVTPF
jgi:hypothetical protein